MRQFGLILTNIDGFEEPTQKIAMRSVSHILGMAASIQSDATEAPFDRVGWSGDGAPGAGRLRDFATGAVTQHFPKSLNRIEGVDFRLPTETELDALEAFILSLGRPVDFDISTMILANTNAERGRGFFLTTDSADGPSAAKCQLCHQNAGAFTENDAGRVFNGNFDTGIEAHTHSIDPLEEHAAITAGFTLPIDGGFGTDFDEITGGFGDGQFNAQSLWEAADTAPFFHNNLAPTLEAAINHYASNEFKDSPEGFFLRSRDSSAADIEVETDNIAAFLRVLNALENIRSATDFLKRARLSDTDTVHDKRLLLAAADINDAIEVLAASDVHTEDASPLLEEALIEIDNASSSTDIEASTTAIDQSIALLASSREIMVVVEPTEITLPLPAEPAPASPDMNDDGVINFLDLGLLKSIFFTTDPSGDFNGDGVVNFLDLGIMKSVFFTTTIPPKDPTDDEAPTVSIDSPALNDTVQETITIVASATDNIAVKKVVFRTGSIVLGQSLAPPFSISWHTRSFSNGEHSIEASASDEAGNTSVSLITVMVDNPPCTSIYGCAVGAPPPPPEPRVPLPPSLDSLPEFKGLVRAKDMQLSTLTIEEISTDPNTGITTPTGVIRTFIVHNETTFNSDFAQNLLHVLEGHRVEGKFINSSAGKEIASIEVSLAKN